VDVMTEKNDRTEDLDGLLGKPAAPEGGKDDGGADLDCILGVFNPPVDVVKWPGRPDVEVAVRALSCYEQGEADFAARRWASAHGIDGADQRDDPEFIFRHQAEMLRFSLAHPQGNHKPIVTSGEALQKRAVRRTLTILGKKMADHCEASAPADDELSDDDCRRVLDDLRKAKFPGLRAELLVSFPPSTLRHLLTVAGDLLPEPEPATKPAADGEADRAFERACGDADRRAMPLRPPRG
jgi:hypothetical protein